MTPSGVLVLSAVQKGKPGVGKPRSLIKLSQNLIKMPQTKLRGFYLRVFGFGYGAKWKTWSGKTSELYYLRFSRTPSFQPRCPPRGGGRGHFESC